MTSLEERLSAVAVGPPNERMLTSSDEPPVDDQDSLDHLARPENYEGSKDIMRRFMYNERRRPVSAAGNQVALSGEQKMSAWKNGQDAEFTRPKTSDASRRSVLFVDSRTPGGLTADNSTVPGDISIGRSPYYSPEGGRSRQGSSQMPRHSAMSLSRALNRKLSRDRVRRLIRVVLINLKWISALVESKDENEADVDREETGKTFTDIAKDLVTVGEALNFDVSYFKANREVSITNEVKKILSLPASSRTPAQIETAMYGLQHMPSFAEYPLHMQTKLCTVGWFQHVPAGRVIIRQGHLAENFYFILSGKAMVRFVEHNPVTGESKMRTASVLRKGSSFGELALLHHSRRTATVISDGGVQLLTIGRSDFFNIIMGRQQQQPGQMPEYIAFLSTLEFMKDWPIEKLDEFPDCCIFNFFKRNTVIVRDSNQTEWIYVVKSGSCRVIKQLQRNAHRQQKAIDQHGECPTPLRAASAFSDISLSTRTGRAVSNNATRLTETAVAARSNQTQTTPLFVQVEILKPGDVFGLRTMNFDEQYETSLPTSFSLVSNGAECVMLARKFFMDNANPSVQRMIRYQVRPYPDESVLEDNYRTKVEWMRYRRRLVSECTGSEPAHPRATAVSRRRASVDGGGATASRRGWSGRTPK